MKLQTGTSCELMKKNDDAKKVFETHPNKLGSAVGSPMQTTCSDTQKSICPNSRISVMQHCCCAGDDTFSGTFVLLISLKLNVHDHAFFLLFCVLAVSGVGVGSWFSHGKGGATSCTGGLFNSGLMHGDKHPSALMLEPKKQFHASSYT